MANCKTHPAAPATHRCDGCGRMLCAQCIDEGHRLLTCRVCGELALPLTAGGSRTAPEHRRAQARSAAYGLPEALFYVFRGLGIYVIGSYAVALAVLAVLGLVPILGVAAGCSSLVFVAMVLFLVPGTLTMIVRDTAAGDNELSDWPEFSQYGERVTEIGGFLISGLIATLPLVVMLKLGGCLGSGHPGDWCWAILGIGWFVAMAIWIPAFGAVSVLHDNFMAIRLDRHALVLARFGAEFWTIVLLSTVLVVTGQVVSIVLAVVPVLGLAVSATAGLYAWFTCAHLIGIFFRRRARELGEIYGKW